MVFGVDPRRRVALVSGSSRGLGSAIARRLGRDGLAVAVNDAHAGVQARRVVEAILADGGVAEAFAADVTDEREVELPVREIEQRLGRVDVLVVNATEPQPEAPITDVAWEDRVAQLEFFVKSPLVLGRAVLPGMRERGGGPDRPDRLRWSSTGRRRAGRRT